MPDDFVVVKLDFSNAFNSLRRDCLLESIAVELPELYRFAYDSYAGCPTLQAGANSIHSQEGTQQGDPLGSLEFCITVQPLLRRLISVIRLGYLDDFTLAGPADAVATDVRTIASEASCLGLHLNITKCEVSSKSAGPHLDKTEFNGFQFVPVDRLMLLGAPVTAGSAVDNAISDKVNVLKKVLSKLKSLQVHDALVLLKNSLCIPKLQYLLRTSACYRSQELLAFDDLLREGLSSILNVDLSKDQWLQASLPVSAGGLGFRSAVALAPSAYLASAAGTRWLQHQILPAEFQQLPDQSFDTSIKHWTEVLGFPLPDESSMGRQAVWDSYTVCNTM